MKNKFYKILKYIFFLLICSNANSNEQFNFDVTEIEILNKGNTYIGKNKGKITTDNGLIINADQFKYDKISNILEAKGNVKINDTVNELIILSDKIIYNKNQEIIYTKNKSKGLNPKKNITIEADNFVYYKITNILEAKKNVVVKDEFRKYNLYTDYLKFLREENFISTLGNSRAIDLVDSSEINADIFEYDIQKNILIAKNKVILENKIEKYKILGNYISYHKSENKIFTIGKTKAFVDPKYKIISNDVVFFKNKMELESDKKTSIDDDINYYELDNFKYSIKDERLIGENILISSNYKLINNDKFYFSSGLINLKTKDFTAKDTKINIHKNIFNNPENDPRLYGVSSVRKKNKTILKKAVFTNCKLTDNCPPWAMQAEEIVHDQDKKQLNYKNATLKVYDFPVFYFPKFFHPDPTVRRQSGLLRPQINNSDELGDSIHIPYFYVISENKDITFKPTIFNDSIKMFQNEYRQKNKNSSFITDFSLTRGYKSTLSEKKKSISHLFAKFNADLMLENFDYSNFYASVQKVTNDTYLKVFDTNLPETELKPSSASNLTSEIKLTLNKTDSNFTSGLKVFENLNLNNNDRYQYILPYYNFDTSLKNYFDFGKINFYSTGNNDLSNTNKLKSSIINDLNFNSNSYISKFGLVNNLNVYLKNSNTIGKNDENYKSSPQVEFMNLYQFTSELPLQKLSGSFKNYLKPKISLKFNPSDMKNYSNASKHVTVENVFNFNRLGLSDSFEKGKSLTVGLDYKRQKLNDINKYFEFKLASVFRESEENFIPKSSSLNKKNSNLFGSLENKFSENFTVDYDFRVDNNYDRFEYNSINTNLKFNNFETSFNFVEETGDAGDTNFIDNQTTYKINDSNYFTFSTRRNRKLNLTEFYDLVYEYKNDCLVASVKYKKKYYSDRDLKPSENLLLTLTIYPFTKYEHNETNLFKN